MISPEATASVNKTKKLHTRNVTWTHMQEQSIYSLTWNFFWPLQPYNQPDKHLHKYRATKEYHRPPVLKVDQLFKEYHGDFILLKD